MSRRLYKHDQTWIDRTTEDLFRTWPRSEQQRLLKEIEKLFDVLKRCTDPLKDASLKRYRPTLYHGVIDLDDIYEYRLGGQTRVVARIKPKWVLMLTITLCHDHNLMKMLLKVHQGTIAEFSPMGTRYPIQSIAYQAPLVSFR
jgi:hypothetical protein